jgi:hypothetical protein
VAGVLVVAAMRPVLGLGVVTGVLDRRDRLMIDSVWIGQVTEVWHGVVTLAMMRMVVGLMRRLS